MTKPRLEFTFLSPIRIRHFFPLLIVYYTQEKFWIHLFFYKQSIFNPRPENYLSFSKKLPQKLFSSCLVDGPLTSIV